MVILDPVKIPIPIPSPVANFLDRYLQGSMEEAIDSLREDFKEWRKEFDSWEESMNRVDYTTVKEVLQWVSKIKSTLKSVKREEYGEIAISATSRVATDLLSGNIGTSAAEPVIKEGINLIRRYFQRRRINIFDANVNQGK